MARALVASYEARQQHVQGPIPREDQARIETSYQWREYSLIINPWSFPKLANVGL